MIFWHVLRYLNLKLENNEYIADIRKYQIYCIQKIPNRPAHQGPGKRRDWKGGRGGIILDYQNIFQIFKIVE